MDHNQNGNEGTVCFKRRADMVHGSSGGKVGYIAAGISPEDIGVIIDTSVSPDYYTPSMSCMIQRETGAVNAMTIDVNCACAGCVYAIDMAKRYLQTDKDIKYALVVANENLTKITDYTTEAHAYCSETARRLWL